MFLLNSLIRTFFVCCSDLEFEAFCVFLMCFLSESIRITHFGSDQRDDLCVRAAVSPSSRWNRMFRSF